MDPVLAALRATDYPYDIVNCDPDLADTAAFCEHYGFALNDSANAILVAGKSEERPVVCCVVLASTRLDVNGVVRKRLGSRKLPLPRLTRRWSAQAGCDRRRHPLGLPSDLPVWIDALVMERTQVIVGGGSRARKVCVRRRQSLRYRRPRSSTRLPRPPASRGSFISSVGVLCAGQGDTLDCSSFDD